jgi:guanylate kinase
MYQEFSMGDIEFVPGQRGPLLIVISGPSGAGKDTIIDCMRQRNLAFHFVVTMTTRKQRDDEVHGRDYFFVNHDQFAEMIEKGELLEYAIVYNDYKGIPREQVRQALLSGKDVVMRLDVQGAETIRTLCPDALLIFLTVKSEVELERRLHQRNPRRRRFRCARLGQARR